MSFYPSADELLSLPADVPYLETHRAWRSILSKMAAFFVSVIVVYLIIYFFGDAHVSDKVPFLKHVSLRWLAVVPAILLVEVFRKYHDDLYILDSNKVSRRLGRWSLNYAAPAVKYVDIRAVIVDQDIFGRILDYGNVELGTSADTSNEIILEGIRSPREYADLIELIRAQKLRDLTEQKREERDASKRIAL